MRKEGGKKGSEGRHHKVDGGLLRSAVADGLQLVKRLKEGISVTVRTSSVRNTSNSKNKFSKKYQYSKSDFSTKYQ